MAVMAETVTRRELAPPAGVFAAPALALHRVAKTFPGPAGETHALGPLDLLVGRGEFVCLLGPSGCGKSTLLLFQDAALFPWLDVQRNVEFGLRQQGMSAARPAILAGIKQGGSFAWRSLMAAELLYYSLSLGYLLQAGRDLNDVARVMAVMLVIITIGVTVDRLGFAPAERRVRERWGLLDR